MKPSIQPPMLLRLFVISLLSLTFALLAGCGGGTDSSSAEESSGLTKIVLQTDWYPQPEHGGFYQALAEGYYEAEGLDVEIIPGGPNSMTTQKVARGTAHFALGRSDDVIIAVSRGVPLMIAGALMQIDPQAIMFHKESGIEGFEDLDGKAIMTTPGAAFIDVMQRKFDINVSVIPLDYGMTRFLNDKNFIQQCFITNEPFYVRREGANPGMLLLNDTGFRPYRVFFTSRQFFKQNPEAVKAFTRASIKGWDSYLNGDRTKANAMIASLNPKMDEEFMAYAVNSMQENRLVSGYPERGEAIGLIRMKRLAEGIQQLSEVGMLEGEVLPEVIFDPVTLPESLRNLPRPSELNFYQDRQSPHDLEIRIERDPTKPVEVRFLSWETLASLPRVEKVETLENAAGEAPAEVIYLDDLLEKSGLSGSFDLVLANCSDGYQSNYSAQVIQRNRPYIITHFAGKSLPQYLEGIGHPEWGPYIIYIEEEDALTDPVNKRPWGVNALIITRSEWALKDWVAANFNPLSPSAQHGKDLFFANCASCHKATTSLGGVLSTRNLAILATFAKHSEEYFIDMLEDPVGTNPTAAKMPAVPHYSDDDVQSLIDFLVAYQGG